MTLSRKQFIFANYLLKKIGFSDPELISDYLNNIESIYGKHNRELITGTHKNGRPFYQWISKYDNSRCIDVLLKEIELKKNLNNIELLDYNFESKISATDLSSFDFCPASFSISKSFQIESFTSDDKRLAGISLHETLRLLNKKIPENHKESDLYTFSVLENEKIKKIKNCELIFAGHTDSKRFFENENKNFIGQPDYIFKDPNGKYFAVEEKFKFLSSYISPEDREDESILTSREKIKQTFFSNHIVQLQSYIDYIQEYNIEYGILIYWFYDFNGDFPNIHSVSLKIVNKKEYQTLLENTHRNLKAFIAEKSLDFLEKVNTNKCTACSVNKYCTHKTNNLSKLKLPYDKNDLILKPVEFPEELKKENNK